MTCQAIHGKHNVGGRAQQGWRRPARIGLGLASGIRRSLLALGALLALAVGLAPASRAQAPPQREITVDAAIKDNLLYAFSSPARGSTELKPLKPENGKVALRLPPGYDRNSRLNIYNVASGTVAHLPFSSTSGLTLSRDDFNHAYVLQVPVRYKGDPAQKLIAILRYEDPFTRATVTKNTWLQPSDNGVARFSDVPLETELWVSVSNGSQISDRIGFSVSSPRDGEFITSPVNVPDDWQNVATIQKAGTAGPGQAETGEEAGTEVSNNPLQAILVSLAVVMILAFGIFWLVDTGRMNGPLRKLGIPIGEPAGQQAAQAFAPAGKSYTPSRVPDAASAPATGGSGTPFVGGPRFVATLGPYTGSIYPLNEPTVSIGRDVANVIALTMDGASSRHHAQIQASNNQCVLEDIGSSNGTFLNGTKVAPRQPQSLRPGDEVQIGHTRFRFEA